jgi:PilZ domain-containing protein
MQSRNIEQLTNAARLLRPVLDELVFVGGCVTGLLITDPAAADIRSTYDVDAIVECHSHLEYYSFATRLQELGFAEDSQGGVICRWRHGKLILDIMPTEARILGFSNRWYTDTMQHSEVYDLNDGLRIRVAAPPYFLATKLEAFEGRGKNDFLASRDLEDIIALIDGRPSVVEELRKAPEPVCEYISSEIGRMLRSTKFKEALPGHLGPEEASQGRLLRILKTLNEIGNLFPREREHYRLASDGVVTLVVAAVQARGQLVNLSESGLQVLCRVSASLGDAVEVRFTPEGYPEEITSKGTIARILPDRVGIAFTDGAAWRETWQKLSKFYAAEPRQFERFPAAAGKATVLVAPNQAECEVENVSRNGMQIRSSIRVAVGDQVEVRFTPQGQSDAITVAGRVARVERDRMGIAFPQVSSWSANWRKMVAFRTVSQKRQEGPLTPEALIAKVAAIQKEAAATPEISAKTAALWKMESLGVTFGRIAQINAQPGETLNNPSLPSEARPIMHVGMGGAAVEVANFDAAEITRLIDSLAHPQYRLFGYEQIGAMLGVYEKTVPRMMLGLKKLNRPDPAKFIPLFPNDAQRLISHGYGRLLYFNSKDLDAALDNIRKREFLDRRAAVQGMAFGYAMVNHLELGVVLESGDSLIEPALVKAFRAGLVYALEFWEWMSPGFLDTLEFPSRRAADLISIARREIAAARQRGFLDPFAVRAFRA